MLAGKEKIMFTLSHAYAHSIGVAVLARVLAGGGDKR